MTTTYLGIQGSYNHLSIALFRNNQCIQVVSGNDDKASSHLVVYLQKILKENGLVLSDLNFIGVDKGPGAFTSLRVTIATVNGLSFARQISLIGVNGLKALFEQTKSQYEKKMDNKNVVVVCLLNAYNNDVYYLIDYLNTAKNIPTTEGCRNIDELLKVLSKGFSGHDLLCVGNGASLHHDLISEAQDNFNSVTFDPTSVCSAEQVGLSAYQMWQRQENLTTKIVPYYLKTQKFAVSQ